MKIETDISVIYCMKSDKISIFFHIKPPNITINVYFVHPSAIFCHKLCLIDVFGW